MGSRFGSPIPKPFYIHNQPNNLVNTMRTELWEATKDQPYFTVEDFRRINLHENIHPNAIGQFFKNLSDKNVIEMCGHSKTTHKAANNRWVFKWRWTL